MLLRLRTLCQQHSGCMKLYHFCHCTIHEDKLCKYRRRPVQIRTSTCRCHMINIVGWNLCTVPVRRCIYFGLRRQCCTSNLYGQCILRCHTGIQHCWRQFLRCVCMLVVVYMCWLQVCIAIRWLPYIPSNRTSKVRCLISLHRFGCSRVLSCTGKSRSLSSTYSVSHRPHRRTSC